MSTAKLMVEVKGARKAYGPLEVLKGIDLSVSRGQIIAIIGPSGSGKSTLLRSINQLELLNAGEIWLDGEQVNRPLKGQAFEKHINAVRQQMGMAKRSSSAVTSTDFVRFERSAANRSSSCRSD